MDIQLNALEQIALQKLARAEKRRPKDQAVMIIRRALEQAGVIAPEKLVVHPQDPADVRA